MSDPYPLFVRDRFGGIDLTDDPAGETIRALDMVDCELEAGGSGLRSRLGFQRFNAVASSVLGTVGWPQALWPFYTQADGSRLIAASDSRIYALDGSGAIVHNFDIADSTTNYLPGAAAAFAQPGSEALYLKTVGEQAMRYMASGATPGFVRWTATILDDVTGAVLATGAPAPQGNGWAVWPGENRLLCFDLDNGGIGGATGPNHLPGGPDYCWISEPGKPETFREDSFELFTPGDGERLMAGCAWRDLVFLFKQRKFFVLTGVTVDAKGVPEYRWRAIDTGLGAIGRNAAVAGRDGVYFIGRRGIYRTTGEAPVLISQALTPLFDYMSAHPWYTGGYTMGAAYATFGDQSSRLWWADERLYVRLKGTFVLVWDSVEDEWFVWKIPTGVPPDATIDYAPFCTFRPNVNDRELLAVYPGRDIYRQSPSLDGVDKDAAGASRNVVWRYHTRFESFGDEHVKRVPGAFVDGYGSVQIARPVDYALSATSTSVMLPAASPPGQDYVHRAARGRRVATLLSGSGPSRVRRVSSRVAPPRTAPDDG